jgi:hypothetical protein
MIMTSLTLKAFNDMFLLPDVRLQRIASSPESA